MHQPPGVSRRVQLVGVVEVAEDVARNACDSRVRHYALDVAWLLADAKPKDDAGHPADYEIAAVGEVLAIVDARAA